MYIMQEYDNSLQYILDNGRLSTNKRTGIKTLSVSGTTQRYRVDEYFPLVTKRKIFPKSMWAELLWIISGSTNVNDLRALGSGIWDSWEDKKFEEKHEYAPGSLGPLYGFNLRYFGGNYNKGWNKYDHGTYRVVYGDNGVDQLQYIINEIKKDPSSRRILFSLWNPQVLDKQKLACCHILFQILIDDENRMDGILYQRSCDAPIGKVYNIGFYTSLLYMIAQQTGYKPYEFIHSIGSDHIYENQIEHVKEYLALPKIDSPKLEITKAKDIFSYSIDSFKLINYNCGPKLNIPVAI